jgi:hypothetical protein
MNSGWTKWMTGEPNNYTRHLDNCVKIYENCVAINWEGKLNDSPCEFKFPFICEFKPLPALA